MLARARSVDGGGQVQQFSGGDGLQLAKLAPLVTRPLFCIAAVATMKCTSHLGQALVENCVQMR